MSPVRSRSRGKAPCRGSGVKPLKLKAILKLSKQYCALDLTIKYWPFGLSDISFIKTAYSLHNYAANAKKVGCKAKLLESCFRAGSFLFGGSLWDLGASPPHAPVLATACRRYAFYRVPSSFLCDNLYATRTFDAVTYRACSPPTTVNW